MKLKKMEIVMILTLILCMAFHFLSFAGGCQNIKKDVLRLHILASSDTAADQALKLKVRDAVLKQGYAVFDGAKTVDEAKLKVRKNLDVIKKIAQDEVRKNGYDYTVDVRLETTFFDTRVYRNFTLPAGEYEALRIVIGSGEGHNWWCVMFPTLCLSACDNLDDIDALSDEEKELIQSNPKMEIRFKCVEIYEKIKKLL